jgi:hypothetical protein
MTEKTLTFINRANIVHNNKYDYSKVEYLSAKQKVCIICPIHGEFFQSPSKHLSKQGCPKCGSLSKNNTRKTTTEEFIRRSKEKYGNKFLYDKCNVKKMQDKEIAMVV